MQLMRKYKNKPNMEKNIMKAVEICTTLLLPICVSPRRPTFSLQYHSDETVKQVSKLWCCLSVMVFYS